MKKGHWDKYHILPNFRRIVRPMMSVQLDRSSASENGIVTSVVTVSSLLESLGVTFDCCSKFEGKSWNERWFKRSMLFSRIYFWHNRSERVIRTRIASCTTAFCAAKFWESAASILNSTCLFNLRVAVRLKISGVPTPSAKTSAQMYWAMASLSLNICSVETVSVNNLSWDWCNNCS